MKRKSYDGYRHIAAAIFVECDFIISWNFKHIVKVKTIQGIKAITTYEGYKASSETDAKAADCQRFQKNLVHVATEERDSFGAAPNLALKCWEK